MTRRLLCALLTLLTFSASAFAEPAASGTGGPHGRLDRTATALALHEFNRQRQGRALSVAPRHVNKDQGNVAVLQDDGTLRVPLNLFDLTNKSLTFTPDTRDLLRVMQGPPRIAPLFQDLTPSATGLVFAETLQDRVIFTWSAVREYGGIARNTFQLTLRSSGIMQFNYFSVNISGAVVAITPGYTSAADFADLSQQSTPRPITGLVAEVFSTAEYLDIVAISQAFNDTHPDVYDTLIVFTDFALGLGDAFAYEVGVRNAISGIMPSASATFDYGAHFGSPQRLSSFVNSGAISQYPTDPQEIFLGTNNTLEVLGQEFGHRWLAFVDTGSGILLGRDAAHWSFFMNSMGSVMEGNEIQDLGGGRFRTVSATYRYSPLDQYIMGLRRPSDVPPWFVVTSPTLVSAPSTFTCVPLNASCSPTIGVELQGTRRDFTVDNVVASMGQRVPAFDDAQKEFSVAFIIITGRGQEANPKSVAHVDTIRSQWETFFNTAVEGRGTMSTRLSQLGPAITTVVPDHVPTLGGTVVTINGSGFSRDSTVSIGGKVAATVFLTEFTLQALVPRSKDAGPVALTVTNPAQSVSATLATAVTYYTQTVSEIEQLLAANGSFTVETVHAPALDVGYATVTGATAVAVLRSFSQGALVSETALPAVTTATKWSLWAEKGMDVGTGVAIVNPNTAAVTVDLKLTDGRHTAFALPAGSQRAAFVDELFNTAQAFDGTLTVEADLPIAVLALHGTTNAQGQFLMTTIPLSAAPAESGGSAGFPIVADGAGYDTELVLVNSGSQPSNGAVAFSFTVATDHGSGSHIPFAIAPGGVWRLRTLNSGALTTGSAVVTAEPGSPLPAATATIHIRSKGDVASEAAVPAQRLLSHGLVFAAQHSTVRTGLALLNPHAAPLQVLVSVRDDKGVGIAATTLDLAPNSRVSAFLDELIAGLPSDLDGTVLLTSTAPLYAVAIRGTSATDGRFLMAVFPTIDLDQALPTPTYLPQIVTGGDFTTELLLAPLGERTAGVRFFTVNGAPMDVSLR